MASIRFAGQQIESWNPAIDARAIEAGRVIVLGGRNYLFDSKGPKSGFGSRIVNGGKLGNETDIQCVDVDSQTLVMSSTGIYRQEYINPQLSDVLEPTTWWRKLKTFDPADSSNLFNTARWHGVYLNGGSFIGNRNYGLFTVSATAATEHTVDGAPSEPIAMAEIAGRLVIVTPTAFIFTSVGDGSDFQPAVGGAGFQLVNQYMAGEPVGMTMNQQLMIIWSRDSAMLAEYIGGEAVFRYDTFNAGLYPLGNMAITPYLQDSAFMMTKHGIVMISGTRIDPSVTPTFNEFIRTYMSDNYNLEVRLDYIAEDDRLYVQLMDSQSAYLQTFVLSVSIDKWGEYSAPHLGFLRMGDERGMTGFADTDGYINKLTDTPDKESRSNGLVGLDSYIDVGYLNTPDMIGTADTMLEIQELMISSRVTFPESANLIIEDWQGDGLYWNIETGDFINEDYNEPVVGFIWSEDMNDDVSDSEVIDDTLNNEGEDDIFDDSLNNEGEEEFPMGEDYNFAAFGNDDWNQSYSEGSREDYNAQDMSQSEDYLIPPLQVTVPVEPGFYEDWNNSSLADEEWNGPFSFNNFITNHIVIYSSMDGLPHEFEFFPVLAAERSTRDLYTTITAGRFQYFRISAYDRWQKYHVTSFDASVNYHGQYS